MKVLFRNLIATYQTRLLSYSFPFLEYEKRKGSQVARHHIKDHRAKQLLVVPNDDKFVAVAAPEAFSRHSGTCMILGGQVRFETSRCSKSNFLDTASQN